MSLCQFGHPVFHISKQGSDQVLVKKSADSSEKYVFENASGVDSCTLEGNSIKKSAKGDAFMYMNFKLGSGVTTWKITLTNSDNSNNSVYVGVAFKPLLNTAIKSTRYSWTLDTFHGNLFHDGQLPELFSHCTSGDTITCVYDGVNKKLSFAKNSEPSVEAFDNVKGADIYPFISFNSKSTSASVEFSEEIACSPNHTHRETVDLIRSELFAGSLPKSLAPERTCIVEGFVRLLRRLMRYKAWQSPIQTSINERLVQMDSIVQLLVNKSNTGHVEVHHLCFSIWPVLSFLAYRDPVLSVGGSVFLEEDNLFGILSLNDQKQTLLYFNARDSKLQSPMQISADKLEALPLGKIEGFDWDQIGPSSILNLAHLSGLWDDEEMNVLTAGAPVLSRGYAKHLLSAQDFKTSPSSTKVVPISITGSLEWRQILMWQMQAMALRTLQTLLSQDRFCQLLTYHPISISAESVREDKGDLAQAVQQVLRQIVLRATSPSPLSPPVSLSCLERTHALLSRNALVKLYTDCTDAVFGSDSADETTLAIAAIPNPPPDIPKLYHPPQMPPPLPPKTRRSSPKPSLPIQPRPPSPDPAFVVSLLEMGFSEQSVRRARRKVKVKAGESIANQTSSLAMWLLEHGDEEDSGAESEMPPPVPPREEPFVFPLTLEQTIAMEGGTLPATPAPPVSDTPSADTTPLPPAKNEKSLTDMFLEALFPDFSKTDFSYIAMLDKQRQRPYKDLLEGPETTAFIRDVYRNIPEVVDEQKEMCKRIVLQKKSNPDLEHVTFSSNDPLGQRAVKSNKISCERENLFSRADGALLSQCSGSMSLDELINSVERVTGAIKTQVSRQLVLLAFSSLSLKPQDFMYGLANIGIPDIVLLLRLFRLSATNRLGCYSQGTDNSVCIASAIKQILSQNRESLTRVIATCTRDILAAVVATKNLSDSYFLNTHTSVNDNTVFATINFPVSKILVETVIDIINSTKSEETERSIYGLVNLADALSACQFSQQLSSDDKEWATEQLVKLLIVSKDDSSTPIQIDLDMVDALTELDGHSKQVMNTIWADKTNRLYSISKDNTIRVWKGADKSLVTESTLEFSSPDAETQQLPPTSPGKSETSHKLIPPSVIPYFAVDVTGQYVAASSEYTLNVWYIDSLAGGSKPVLKAVEKLDRLVTFSSFRPPPTPSPTDTEPKEYTPLLIIACVDGSVHAASVKLDRTGEGNLDVDIRELKDARLSDTGAVSKLVWDESGQTMAVGSSRGTVTLFSQKSVQEDVKRDKTLVLHENVVQNLQFNPSGTLLATLADREAIKVSGRLNGEWDSIGFIALPNQSCFTWLQYDKPQSKDLLACGGDRGTVHVWSIPHWPYDIQVASQSDASALLEKQIELSTTCYSSSGQLTCLAFSLSGVFLVAGHSDGTISMWLTNSGEHVLSTQIAPAVVSLSTAGPDRIISCHLPSSSLYSLPLTPEVVFRTRSLYHCQAKLRRTGIERIDCAPFLKAFLSQLGALMHRQHKFEQQEIEGQKQLTHTRLHQSLSALSLGLDLDRLWSETDLSELFPSSALLADVNPESWRWLTKFRQALNAVGSFSKRSSLPDNFPGPAQEELSECEREARQADTWSVDMDTQLVQWSNQHPEDWIVGGKARVYFWGAGGSGQLGNESKSINRPELCEYLECTQRVMAGVNCTYSINNDGSVYSFGDGGYGKLGHNNSESFAIPQCIEALQGYIVVQLSVSKTGDGHCLALTHTGDTFSWGDGEYGRLGHGDSTKQRRPKRIEGLKGKKVVEVSAGDKYSAVVTEEGHLYTFGSGAEGKTGHGNSDSKRAPKLVTKFMKNGEEINVKIGQVCCSQSHTLAVSRDEMEVFSFGDGARYKLGNNSSTSVFVPQAIPELSGVGVSKVASGISFSLALSNNGKVYAWGQGTECCSDTEVQVPRVLGADIVHGLSNEQVVDIQAGPDYALALTKSGEVWAWGSNKEGQLGLGDKDPRTQPCVVMDLIGKSIKQISAGKCHAAASTTPPLSAFSPLIELGQPACVPTKYTALTSVQTELLQARLKLLNQFSALIFSTWTLFSFNPFEFNSLDVLQSAQLSNPSIRPILSQNVYRSNMLRILTHTMIASKSYGPMITVRRFPSEGHKPKPLFYQISPQILAKPKELLLPQRAWKVTLIGEGADDAGGVFDETIALMCIELEDGTLPYLIPTPNARNRCGYNNDRFVFNPDCTNKKDLEHFRFIGVLFGVAVRTKKPLALHLAPLVWKLVAGMEITMDDLEEIDVAFMQAMRGIRHLSRDITPETFSEMIPISSFEAYNMAGQLTPVMTGGSNIPLTYSNRKEYVERAIQFRLHELDRQALAVREGMGLIIPVPLLGLTTGGQLEVAVCGEKELDIQILKKVSKYRDCSASDTLIQWLWDTLENFTNDEKILFLRFTSGRSRLPARVQDVTQRLLIVKTMKNRGLPTAQTCFFQLKLPDYPSQDILTSRLRYAINNCRSIDTDSYMLPRNTENGTYTDSDDSY